MSKKSSAGRKLDPIRVEMAKKVERARHELAMKMVSERVKVDAEFAADVLKIGGETLREDIKKDALETIAKHNGEIVEQLKPTGQTIDGVPVLATKSIEGQEITREKALEGLGDPSTWEKDKQEVLKEFQAKPEDHGYDFNKEQVREYMDKNGLKPMIPDGGCSVVERTPEELQAVLDKLSKDHTEKLKEAGLDKLPVIKGTLVKADSRTKDRPY